MRLAAPLVCTCAKTWKPHVGPRISVQAAWYLFSAGERHPEEGRAPAAPAGQGEGGGEPGAPGAREEPGGGQVRAVRAPQARAAAGWIHERAVPPGGFMRKERVFFFQARRAS